MQRFVFAVFAATLLACSSNVSPETGTGSTKAQACDELAKSTCDVFQRCAPILVSSVFGDLATCIARSNKSCAPVLDAPSTSATPSKLSTCAAAFKTMSCEAVLSAPATGCVPDPGGLADGAACFDDAQCKSTWCPKAGDDSCGKCAPLSTSGQACLTLTGAGGSPSKECSRGLTCAKDVCVTPVASGGACTGAVPCANGLTCFGGKCTLGAKPGAKCDPEGVTDPTCDFLQGATCNPATKVCQAFVVANAGQACGADGGGYKICSAGSECVVPTGMMTGTCIAPAIDGGKCDADKGPGCLAPAKCVGGVCKLPDPSLCK